MAPVRGISREVSEGKVKLSPGVKTAGKVVLLLAAGGLAWELFLKPAAAAATGAAPPAGSA